MDEPVRTGLDSIGEIDRGLFSLNGGAPQLGSIARGEYCPNREWCERLAGRAAACFVRLVEAEEEHRPGQISRDFEP